MKKWIGYTLALILALSCLQAKECCTPCDFSDFKLNSDAVYQQGSGARESAATCLGASMLAWGIGLTIAIAIIAGVVHQSKASDAH